MEIQSYFNEQIKQIDRRLDSYLPNGSKHPAVLHKAMRYGVLSGGKRIRPILALAACEAVGGRTKDAMPAACALELIHNYSLIHDDLPCMDNDDLRRGRPTCHKKFGESMALLAGDALLTLAFQILNSPNGSADASTLKRQAQTTYFIAHAIGAEGMVGGQAVDIQFQNKEMDLPTIEYVNTHKTGALIAVSLKAGATLGGGSQKQTEVLFRYGKYLGFIFQIVDDIMDREGYAKALGVTEARKETQRLQLKAMKLLKPFGARASILSKITDFLLTRKY